MYDAFGHVLTTTEQPLPMEIVGWAVLLSGLLIAAAWLVYLYR